MRCASPTAATAASSPLTRELVDLIGERWIRGGDFAAIADALVDHIASHIRQHGVAGALDPRLAFAMADAISDHAERELHAPAAEPGQRTLAELLEREPSPEDTIVARVDRDGRVVDVRHAFGSRRVRL